MHKIHFLLGLHSGPRWESLRRSPNPLSDSEGDTHFPYPLPISTPCPSTPSASRSRRLRNEVVKGPHENGVLGPTVALGGPVGPDSVKPEIFACPLFREFRDLGKFAKITGREYGRRDDLLCFYSTVIRPVLECACPVWHSSLTATQTKALELLQCRALCIIYYDGDYTILRIRAGLDTLESRREQLTERFNRSVLPETSCLHYLLPFKRDFSVTGRLHHARTLEPLKPGTVKFRHSFLPYCLDHYI